jgi:hypothetical protein
MSTVSYLDRFLVLCQHEEFGCHGQRPEEVGRVNGELMGLVQ